MTDMHIERNILNLLKVWKNDLSRKPIELKDTRHVGTAFILK
jgi:hypothetical protein